MLTPLLPGPNEKRCITRELLDFYRALVVGGIYQFADPVNIKSESTYVYALRQCLDRHPLLSVIIAKAETESPYYAFCPRLDLSQHIQFLDAGDKRNRDESEIETIERLLPVILDKKWTAAIPHWRIVVLPLSHRRCFIAFAFSHGLGDGMSGIAFHRTFLNALQDERIDNDLIYTPTRKPLLPAFDTPESLPISWSFLLAPLLGEYLPERVASFFGFRSTASSITPSTWTGAPAFYSPDSYRTSVKILSIDAATVDDALKLCRMNGAKLTGLLHQLVITAIFESLPRPNEVDSLAAGTAINLRHTIGVPNDEMGLYVSADYKIHLLPKPNVKAAAEFSWELSTSTTERLATVSNQLQDQSVGLLRYLSSIRSWSLSKLGKRRDDSYEISNLLSFRPAGLVRRCAVTEMVFCQPANIIGPAIAFNVVSAADGPLNIAVNWQAGALSLASYADEVEFVEKVCRKIKMDFARLS